MFDLQESPESLKMMGFAPSYVISCRDEADLHWLCVTLLVFWQEWVVVYDKQGSVTYRLVTALEALRDTLYSSQLEADEWFAN